MQIEFKKLEKASKLFEKIKAVDARIIELEKFAMLVANGETKTSITLNIEDLAKKEETENKVKFDEDGSLVLPRSSLQLSYFSFFAPNPPAKETPSGESLNKVLSENATLQILGVLLLETTQEREKLLHSLENV